MAIDRCLGRVTGEPDTTATALVAAMATRVHPLKQQSQQTQVKYPCYIRILLLFLLPIHLSPVLPLPLLYFLSSLFILKYFYEQIMQASQYIALLT